MSIHPAVWVVIGAIVSIASTLIGDKLIVFFYVGLVFLAIGIFKFVVLLTGKDEKVPRHLHGHSNQTKSICYFCKNHVGDTDTFCRVCGSRLR